MINETQKQNEEMDVKQMEKKIQERIAKQFRPTQAFVGASWAALGVGMIAFCTGLVNSSLQLNEKGYYFTILLFGLFSVISVQKSIRDKSEGIPVTDIYYGISWFTTIAAIILLVVGLRHADLLLSEKGFYGMSFALAIFAAVAVQKNTRDLKANSKDD